MLRLIVLSCGLALATAAHGAANQMISQAANYDEFSKQFCSASRDAEHIFVLPSAVFSQQKSIKCDDGEYQLRVSEHQDDPGHNIFNIDPPHGSKASLDCDGKADIGMTTIAINCVPVAKETKSHPKD